MKYSVVLLIIAFQLRTGNVSGQSAKPLSTTSVKADTLSVAFVSNATTAQLLKLTSNYKLLECTILLSNGKAVMMGPWENLRPAVRHGSIIAFENIYVQKGNAKFRLVGKTIFVR
jgi:hypothetical protein